MIFIKNFIKYLRWLCCLFVFLASCKNENEYRQLKLSANDSTDIKQKNVRAFVSIENSKFLINSGDLIVRTGNDFTSESLRQLSARDKTYSHCGIASIEKDSVFVYHAEGGEWNPDEKLRKDPMELFCNPLENRGFGVYSFNLNLKQTHSLDSVVKAWYKKEIMFDMKFDLATSDRMYCAEFVSKAVSAATNNQINFATTKINNFEYVSIDNLFLNNFCTEKKRIRY